LVKDPGLVVAARAAARDELQQGVMSNTLAALRAYETRMMANAGVQLDEAGSDNNIGSGTPIS
jgi:hypothetical protein